MSSAPARPQIHLNKGREKSLLRRHPWVFSGAIQRISGTPNAGDLVEILDNKGNKLAIASYSPRSQIRARIWSFDTRTLIDNEFFIRRIERAQALRSEMIERLELTGYRLVAAEADGLPGITIDKYDRYLVCQLLSTGADHFRPHLVAALRHLYPDSDVFERSDVSVRKKEGLKPVTGVLFGEAPPALVTIEENNGVKIQVDIQEGHKTGFYLDQRDNRAIASLYCKDKSVLNCFCYTGGFGVYALKGGASHVENVDVSQTALEIARSNTALNGLDLSKASFINEDVFKLLRRYRDEGRQFDTIILDPPKFIENKSQLTKGARGYKDINMIAMQLLRSGGTLMTYSCSGLMDSDLFQKIVADAALDAQRDAYIIDRLSQAGDHPIATPYPEGFYLKGLILKVF